MLPSPRTPCHLSASPFKGQGQLAVHRSAVEDEPVRTCRSSACTALTTASMMRSRCAPTSAVWEKSDDRPVSSLRHERNGSLRFHFLTSGESFAVPPARQRTPGVLQQPRGMRRARRSAAAASGALNTTWQNAPTRTLFAGQGALTIPARARPTAPAFAWSCVTGYGLSGSLARSTPTPLAAKERTPPREWTWSCTRRVAAITRLTGHSMARH
jgi:hypothetical protein